MNRKWKKVCALVLCYATIVAPLSSPLLSADKSQNSLSGSTNGKADSSLIPASPSVAVPPPPPPSSDQNLLGENRSGDLLGAAGAKDAPSDFIGAIDPQHYMIDTGDKIQVSIVGGISETYVATVNFEGQLVLPPIGIFPARERLLSDLQQDILKQLKRLFKNVSFSVFLAVPRSFKIFVLGEIVSPQAMTITPLLRLSEIIQNAGGIGPSGSRQRIQVKSKRGEAKVYNLQNFFREGDLNQNPTLLEGDTVFVPLRGESVYIGGGVEFPGTYELGADMKTLVQLVKTSRPMTAAKIPDNGVILIQRRSSQNHESEVQVRLIDLLAKTVELKSGDIVQYPFISAGLTPVESDKVYVNGQVNVPGAYSYSSHLSFQDYIGMSGGLTLRANFKAAHIIKKNGVSYSMQDQPRLEPGDTLYIPEVTFKFWQDHLAIITAFLGIMTTTLAITNIAK